MVVEEIKELLFFILILGKQNISLVDESRLLLDSSYYLNYEGFILWLSTTPFMDISVKGIPFYAKLSLLGE